MPMKQRRNTLVLGRAILLLSIVVIKCGEKIHTCRQNVGKMSSFIHKESLGKYVLKAVAFMIKTLFISATYCASHSSQLPSLVLTNSLCYDNQSNVIHFETISRTPTPSNEITIATSLRCSDQCI